MSRPEREIARRLSETPVYAPPAGLLARLQAEIPSGLQAAEAEPFRGPTRRRPARWLAAAAVAFTVAGAGWLVWRVQAPPLLPETRVRPASAPADPAPVGGAEPQEPEVEAPVSAPPAARKPTPASPRQEPPPVQAEPAPGGVVGGAAAPPPPPEPAPQAAYEAAPLAEAAELPEKVEREAKSLESRELRRQDSAAAAPEPARAKAAALRRCPLVLVLSLPAAREAEAWLELDPASVARWRREGTEGWTDAALSAPAPLGDLPAARRVELRYELELLPDAPPDRSPGRLRWRYSPRGGGAAVEGSRALSCTT